MLELKFASKEDELEFEKLIEPIIQSATFQSQKNIPHHTYSTVYEHVLDVAKFCYIKAKETNDIYDIPSLVKAALLHDYFLYNWRKESNRKKPHGFKHPQIAIDNALKEFNLTKKEMDAIRAHMWPLTFFHWPKSKEGWLLSWADKVITYKDFILRRKAKDGKKEN